MIIENNIPQSKSKKRNFKEMISQIKQPVRDIYKFYPCKKKKFSSEINETQLLIYRDFETLNQLQKDLQNLKLKTNNFKSENFELEKPDLSLNKNDLVNYFENDCDMPEIIDIPIGKGKNIYTNSNVDEDDSENELNETNESSDSYSNSHCDNEIPFVSQSYKIKEKIIDNAIKSEKMLNKIFNNLNPSLQPNKDNGIILYEDMKKIKENMDKDMLINYILTFSCHKNKDNEMEIVLDDTNEERGCVEICDIISQFNEEKREKNIFVGLSRNIHDSNYQRSNLASKDNNFLSYNLHDYISPNNSENDFIYVTSNDEMYLD